MPATPKIVVLAGPGESTDILFHALDRAFGVHRIIVETEIAKCVGRIEPNTVFALAGRENAGDQFGPEAELNALMDALVEIDLRARAGASCRQALEFIVEIGPIDRNIPRDAGK